MKQELRNNFEEIVISSSGGVTLLSFTKENKNEHKSSNTSSWRK